MPDDEHVRRRLLRVGSLVASILWAAFAVLALLGEQLSWAIVLAAVSILSGSAIAVGRAWGSGAGGSFFVLLVIVGLTLTSIIRGGLESSVAQWHAVIPLIAVLGGRPRKAWLWGGICAATILGVAVAEHQGLLGERAPPTQLGPLLSTAALLGVVAVLAVLFHRSAVASLARQQRLQRELFDAQRLDGLGRFAGGIAHDFNNLLVIIATRAELAASVETNSEERSKDLSAVLAAARQGAALTRDLLAFAADPMMDSKETLQPCDVARDVAALLTRALPSNVHLDLQIDASSGLVMMDDRRLHRVLTNLVLNARDAMPNGGRIRLAVAPFVGTQPGAQARSRMHVRLRVADEGIGLSERARSRMFEPFFTTKSGGTGLGLATVNRIVRESGGFIDVSSTAGQGTTFDVYLPVMSSSDATDELPAVHAP